jgi:hypothetical protein
VKCALAAVLIFSGAGAAAASGQVRHGRDTTLKLTVADVGWRLPDEALHVISQGDRIVVRGADYRRPHDTLTGRIERGPGMVKLFLTDSASASEASTNGFDWLPVRYEATVSGVQPGRYDVQVLREHGQGAEVDLRVASVEVGQ